MKKICYIVSDINKALAFEWTASHFNARASLFFILIGAGNSRLAQYLAEKNIRHFELKDEKVKGQWSMWWQVLRILRNEKPDIVHTHLWRASTLGITAAWIARVPRRIFTRHHAIIHYREYPSGRKWDVLLNRLATDIVAISENVKDILITRDKADPGKVLIIHHGFDLTYFGHVDNDRVDMIRKKYGLIHKTIIGVVARYLEWKGIQDVIGGFSELLEKIPDAHLVLANTVGDYADEIRKLLNRLPPGSYSEISFEPDVAALYRVFDVYVHAPVDRHVEAFGQTYIEALAAGIPSVFTLSGVAPEFVGHDVNALAVAYRNPQAIADAVLRIIREPGLKARLVTNGLSSVKRFELKTMLNGLEKLYA